MRRQIEVTVPIRLEASITFLVDSADEVTPELIEVKISEAQLLRDRAGEDEGGVYWTNAQALGEPTLYDPNIEG